MPEEQLTRHSFSSLLDDEENDESLEKGGEGSEWEEDDNSENEDEDEEWKEEDNEENF